MSCGKVSTDDITPQTLLTSKQYSLEISKALYSSIKISNYNFKETKEAFISTISNHEDNIVRNTTHSLLTNQRFNKLFNNTLSENARSSADEVGAINLENVKNEINSSALSENVRKRIIQLGRRLSNLKAQLNQNGNSDPAVVKSEIDKEISSFEGNIMNDNSLSLDEKTKVFSFTIATRDNLDNIKQLLTGTNSNGRKGCFFCNIINIFVTVVVAVAVIAVAAVVIIAAASIAIEGAVAAATIATAAAYGASVGAILGVTYVATDNCLDIVDYGQNVYGTQVGFMLAQC